MNDVVARIRAYVDEELANGEPAIDAATRVVGRLRTENPALLQQWLDLQAVPTIMGMVRTIDASARAHARHAAPVSAFAEAIAEGASGAQGWLDARYSVDANHTRLPLRMMRRDHLTYVAGQYNARAQSALLESAFMHAIARRVGLQRVGDVFTDDQLTNLYQHVTGVAV